MTICQESLQWAEICPKSGEECNFACMELFGLIGYPLNHSFSRQYFLAKFRKLGLTDCDYRNFPIADIGAFPHLLSTFPRIRGLNVTAPHKLSVMQYLYRISREAREIGAVNAISIVDGECYGDNTDWIGFRDSLSPLLDRRDGKPTALILGTGGAAHAVAYALAELRIPFHIASRTGHNGTLRMDAIPDALLSETKLIVNATPLGTYPETELAPPLHYEALGPNHLLYDLVYNPEMTTFMERGLQQGAEVQNGLEMLTLQAEAAWTLWQSVLSRG